jgi:hypothetical protein
LAFAAVDATVVDVTALARLEHRLGKCRPQGGCARAA